MKRLIVLLIFCYSFAYASAQLLTISGQLTDQLNQPLIGANAVVLKPQDSTFITGVTADLEGNFMLTNVQPGKVLLKFSYIGYEDLFLTKELSDQPLLLGALVLKEKATKLNEVSIVGTVTPVQQKGDTTQINAGAFKTNPDANAEDLVTKMPGISIDNGKVQAQGEDVQKVLVDGREFFGDDANAVLKNLPAEVIDKIQIFDKKSTQSELTGFDDGNTSKTINIVTKQQFKNGTFGRISGAYGYEDKWKAVMNLNFFKDKRRITFLANSNNLNDQNFSSEDLLGVMGSSGGKGGGRKGGGKKGGGGGGPPNDAGNFLVDQKSGITTTSSFGINYGDKWENLEITGSYFINYSNNSSINDLFRQYITNPNEGLVYTEYRKNESRNNNHRANFKLDWKIDSANTLIFQPRFSVQQNNGSSPLLGGNWQGTTLLSSTRSDYSSNLAGFSFSAPLVYRHAFPKKGRTFSINLSPGYNQNEGYSNLKSLTSYLSDTLSADAINQMANLDVQGLTASSNLTYTEPLNTNSQLMFNYAVNFNKNTSDKETFNFTPAENKYSRLDTTLSNNFNSLYVTQAVGTSYRYKQEKWNLTTGVSYQYAQLHGEQIFPGNFKLDKTFNSILPSAQFQYKFANKKTLRASYRSNNNAPAISQLQNVIDNSNPLQLSTGNPELKQNWQNNLTLRYAVSNTEKSTSFFSLLSGTYTQNYIVNSTIIASEDTLIAPGVILARGSQFSRPVNLDGYFNVRSFNNYSFPLTKLKSNLHFNLGGTYSRTPGMVNNKLNWASSYNVGFGFALSSNISERVDFTLSSNTTYNTISNTLQAGLNSNYYNQTSKFKIQVMPWKGLVLQTDLNHQYNSGLSQNFNQNYLLWNAAIGYKFLKKQQAELRLSVFDIMKQNNSITRNTTETYYEDIRTNALQQYFLLSFIYNIKYFKETKLPE